MSTEALFDPIESNLEYVQVEYRWYDVSIHALDDSLKKFGEQYVEFQNRFKEKTGKDIKKLRCIKHENERLEEAHVFWFGSKKHRFAANKS